LAHASITVTAHIYADPYDDGLDDVASALDVLDDTRKESSRIGGGFGRMAFLT
jgi:hypothetical protein